MQTPFFFTQKSLNPEIVRLAASLLLAATLAVVAGCGGGGGGTSTTAAPITTPPPLLPVLGTPAAAIQLLTSNTQMASSGAVALDLTAIVLSSTRQAVSGRTVIFSTGAVATETAFINNISAVGISDANGLVTAKLNLGANKVNRTITMTAGADSATATTTVDVTGTTISMSGSSSLAFNATTPLILTVKDSAGTGLKNITVTVVSNTGNTIALTPATGITDSSGQITVSVTASKAGNDVITATAAGASATQALTISADSFAITAPALVAPAATIDIPLNTATAVGALWTQAGVAQVGKAVTFSASRGTIAGSPATTTGAGSTTGVTVSSNSAGPAIITAAGPGGTPAATLNVVFVATSASNATVQAVPGTVQVTTGSALQTNNSSTISVLVRDAANNLVKNAGVNFTITTDPSGGRLTSATGITDASGSASVTYVAGATSSAQNGVTISASVTTVGGVAITAVTGTTTLTVSGQSLLVRLGTDNLVGGTAPTNIKTYIAIVTDAAGNPTVGATVQFALRPGRYRKGFFALATQSGVTSWTQATVAAVAPSTTATGGAVTFTCPNLDVNFNGILDPGEGLVTFPAGVTQALLPGAVASVNASAVTDASGFATANISYPKDQSYWSEVTLEARTSVTTNDPPTQVTFFLPGKAIDYSDVTVAPPGQVSPYGLGTVTAATPTPSCLDTL